MKILNIIGHRLIALCVLMVIAGSAGGCSTGAPLSPTAIAATTFTSAPPTANSSSTSPLPSATATAASTQTAAPTETSTQFIPTVTPTITPTPSLTPTNTPIYNQAGLYPVGRCVQFGFIFSDPAPGGTGVVSLCIVNVQVNKNKSLQFNMLWHLVSTSSGVTPSRYVYGNIDTVYLSDEFGNRYDPIANSGKAPDRDENHDGPDSISGWYLFPPPLKEAWVFTFHDDDGKSVSIPNLTFKIQ